MFWISGFGGYDVYGEISWIRGRGLLLPGLFFKISSFFVPSFVWISGNCELSVAFKEERKKGLFKEFGTVGKSGKKGSPL